MKIKLKVILFSALFFSLSSVNVFARSGCCSHHGGVCGCGCCDGTGLSAKCAPYYPECNGSNDDYESDYSEPTAIPTRRPIPTRIPTRVPTRKLTPVSTLIPTKVPTRKPTPTLKPTPTTVSTPTPVSTEAPISSPTKIMIENKPRQSEGNSFFGKLFKFLFGDK